MFQQTVHVVLCRGKIIIIIIIIIIVVVVVVVVFSVVINAFKF